MAGSDTPRGTTNPLFNDRKLKLGTFCTNLSGGCTISSMEGMLEADWSSTAALAKLADEMEFEAIVPIGRWKGFGGVTDFNGAGFECFTFAAGVGAQTRNPAVFATSHVPSIHPVMAAKQATTVDHISGGRFTLNIVTGWHKAEIEIFGSEMLEHDERYVCAAEWLEIILRLWTEDEPVDHEGRYYKVKQARHRPFPIQRPRPALMSAGSSKAGRNFAAKYCDVGFTTLDAHDPASMRARVDSYRRLAREEYGREIQVWTNAYVFQGETEAEAKRLYHYCVHEKGDWEAAGNLLTTLGVHSQGLPPEALERLKEHFIAGWAGYPLIGTKDQVVDGLAALSEAGFDGVVLSWAPYLSGMRQFQAETLPLVIQAGLR